MMERTPAVTHDVLCVGLAFLDITFGGLPRSGPMLGAELWTSDWGVGPGGVANFALTVAHLGGRAGLATVVGDDVPGDLFMAECARQGIDLTSTLRAPHWRHPVTAALTYAGDRALVTGGTPPPLSIDEHLAHRLPAATTAVAHLPADRPEWFPAASRAGMRIVGQVGWDATGTWDTCHLDALDDCWAFLPNEREAMAFTRAETVELALRRLADRVPVVVITRGVRGALALDASSGLRVDTPAMPVELVDATGAGDMFAAAFALASARGCSLPAALDLATTTAALGVSRPGGASSAPTLPEVLQALAARPAHLDEISTRLATSTP